MNTQIKVLLVDDHTLVRGMLADRLDKEPDLTVVGNAGTADEAIRMARKCRPDIILMDIDMPGLFCFEAVGRLAAILPRTRIIFLSAFVEESYVEQALQVNARGYLTKSESADTVIMALREVASGGAFYSAEVRSRIVIDSSGAKLGHSRKTRASTLTNRELDILRYLAKGLGKKDIARITHISVKTVDHHATSIMKKLDIHDRVELARFAIREGITRA